MMTPLLSCCASLLAFAQVALNVLHFLQWLQLAFWIVSFCIISMLRLVARSRLIHGVTPHDADFRRRGARVALGLESRVRVAAGLEAFESQESDFFFPIHRNTFPHSAFQRQPSTPTRSPHCQLYSGVLKLGDGAVGTSGEGCKRAAPQLLGTRSPRGNRTP